MNRQPVSSSNIQAIGYDAKSRLLEIEFIGGSIYEYYLVPTETHQELMKAGSKGSYFHRQIRNSYKYRRVG